MNLKLLFVPQVTVVRIHAFSVRTDNSVFE
jgi:hypothetical protein